jgi:hypothetical protein
MKKWLKRNGRWILTGFGVLDIAYGIFGLIITDSEWVIIVNIIGITLWVIVILTISGILEKVFIWWSKD